MYDLLADAARWPLIFSSAVHVEKLEAGATGERLRWWAVANGAIRNWTSRRAFDPDGRRIRFRQETPLPPVASMTGEWVLVPLPGNVTSVVLLHEFRAIGDDPANTALIKQAVDRNSTAELAELKATAELGEQLPHLVRSFADTVVVEASLGRVYDFLYRVNEWPGRLPHVARVVLDEAVPNVQTVEMQTCGVEGSLQTARMVRVCSPHHSIVYKQIEPPDILSAHLGGWYLYPTAEGVRVTAHNTVMIRPADVGGLVGRSGVNGAHQGYGPTGSTGLNGTHGAHGANGSYGSHAANGGHLNGHFVGARPVNGIHPQHGTNGINGAGRPLGHGGPHDRVTDHRFASAVERAVEQVRQSLRENCLAVLAHAKKLAVNEAGDLGIGGPRPEPSLLHGRLPTPAVWTD